MTHVLRMFCVATAALLVSAGSVHAQNAKPADLRAENRAERAQMGIRPDLRRVDDRLGDLAEAARARHHDGEEALALTARLDRVDTPSADALVRARHGGAAKDAHVARVLGKKTVDRREREEFTAADMALQIKKLKGLDFDKSGLQAKIGEDERNALERQKREDVKGTSAESGAERHGDRIQDFQDRRETQEESLRQRLEEQKAAKQEAKDDKAADKAADKAEKKAEATADKKADAADRAKDRADDRKDVRTDAKTDAAADKKTP